MNGLHGIIFSYEKPTVLGDLIAHRIHGSIPFAGEYRIIDFMLSNLVNAGVDDVGVIMHGKCQSLMDHMGSGKAWDLSRKEGGLKMLPAFATYESRGEVGKYRGKVEALYNVMDYLRHIRQDYVVLCDSDVVVNLPLRDVWEAHMASGADITCVCTDHPGAKEDLYFTVDENKRITEVRFDVPAPHGLKSLNLFIMGKEFLLNVVEDCISRGLTDFQGGVLQTGVDKYKLMAWQWSGYEAHIDSVKSYFDRSMELLTPEIRNQLFCAERPIYDKASDEAATYIDPDSECVNSLIPEGCDIQGSVRNCILFRGVQIEKGATAENCILFKDTVVHAGAELRYIIADKNVDFGANVKLSGNENYPVVIAKNSKI